MAMSRREFVGCSIGALVVRASLPNGWLTPEPCVILDLGSSCCLRESVAGYASAMGAETQVTDAWSVPRCAALIVPAALEIPAAAAHAMQTCLRRGGTVILESGAGFAGEPAFRAQRAVLRDVFDIEIAPPVQLWPARSVPYVDYTWPRPTRVRDFSRVVSLESRSAHVIARVGGLPVALRRRSGAGELVVLGSPLGPARLAGDAEAIRWLKEVLQ